MDKIIFIPSAILGLILILVYWYRCKQAYIEFNLVVMVNAVLQSSGVICGVLLVAGTFFEEARKLLHEIDLYIFISGLVVFSASLKGIHKDIVVSTRVRSEKSKSSNN